MTKRKSGAPQEPQAPAAPVAPVAGDFVHSGSADATIHEVVSVDGESFTAVCGRTYEIGPQAGDADEAPVCQYCADGATAPDGEPEPVAIAPRARAAAEPEPDPQHTKLRAKAETAIGAVLQAMAEKPNVADARAFLATMQATIDTLRPMVPARRGGGKGARTERGTRLSVAANGRCPGTGQPPDGEVTPGFHSWAKCPACGTRRIVNEKRGVMASHPNPPSAAAAAAPEPEAPEPEAPPTEPEAGEEEAGAE